MTPELAKVIEADLRDKLAEAWGAIDMALHELGVPGPDYPAPVANAVRILRAVGGFEVARFEAYDLTEKGRAALAAERGR